MTLSAGTRLGPYEVVELLGKGGMGEVYRARDSRLGRDVALKVLHEDVSRDPDRLKRFEQEARAVAALNHPHILTVHDVGSHEGTPYVVTELLEGENLREVLSRRSPTQRQVLGWAVQAAQGLAAAHQKGIVHRDLKLENLFLTTEGRIKVLDFGLAKVASTGVDSEEVTASSPTKPGVLMGTVAYMSPEQVQARPVDGRSDIFSLGVVLYELLGRRHPFRRETVAGTVGAILQEVPAPLGSLDPAIPRAVDGIVRRCLEKRREERFQGAHDLGLALEAVLAAPTGAAALDEVEERSPYPGLMSFTEKDAAFFFGREVEVKVLWERIRSRRLLAVIGPSGVGKTSFLRAGVVASRPEGWAAVLTTPGANPTLALARALTPELAGDAEAIGELLSGLEELRQTGEVRRVVAAVKRWRSRQAETLLALDQFEELFTLNPPETPARVAALVAALVSEADVHVLLSMRDDFLIRCSDHEPLAPVFESLTPLAALSREGLRRAVVEPAKKRGYRFEDEALVDEMVTTVEGARGALPLLAFAVARLWDKRDHDRKLLTREVYRDIAGVEGALAQHAEATMDRIGTERQGLVRELLRNLVTAQGTRAVIDREELLSAFPDRAGAEEVLRQLIDARLLTTYEVEGREGEPSRHRVEVVHESLLKAWPRLVRWQAQDEEGSVLRDQLKQAAHLWEEKGRTSDLLWTGTAYQEYELWRQRYPGGLTALEEDFARSMGEKARRKKRLVRLVATAAFLAITAVAVAIGVSRQQAVRSARRAEASKLVALGRNELDRYPTAALAYARKSLETADTDEARRLAVEALWRAPSARILPLPEGRTSWRGAFAPDGRRFAAYTFSEFVTLYDDDGRPPRDLGGFPQPSGPPPIFFSPRGDRLAAGYVVNVTGRGPTFRLRVVDLPEGVEGRTIERDHARFALVAPGSGTTLLGRTEGGVLTLEQVAWDGGTPQPAGAVREPIDFAPFGDRLFVLRKDRVLVRPLEGPASTPEQTAAILPEAGLGTPARLEVSPRGVPAVILETEEQKTLVLPASGSAPFSPARVLRMPAADPQCPPAFDTPGARLAWGSSANAQVSVWDLEGPPDAEPLALERPGVAAVKQALFSPGGDWLAVANHESYTFWAVAQPWSRVIHRHADALGQLRFTPDSSALLSCAADGLGAWPLTAESGPGRRSTGERTCQGLAISADGRQTAWVRPQGIQVGPGPVRSGRWLFQQRQVLETACVGAAFDASGRRLAMGAGYARSRESLVVRVFDLATGSERAIPLVPPGEAFAGYEWGAGNLVFTPDGGLLTAGSGGLRRFDVDTGAREWLWRADVKNDMQMALGPDGNSVAAVLLPWENRGEAPHRLIVLDLATRRERAIATHGQSLTCVAFSPSGEVLVTGDEEGAVRVGPIDGGEPHLLLGHTVPVNTVAVSPDGRWIASGAGSEIRLWPMPDVTKPPLHTLPYDELMAKLRALTNLHVAEDKAAAAGYKLEVGPFPGWRDVPTW